MTPMCDVYPASLHSAVSLSPLCGRGAGDRACGILHTGDLMLGRPACNFTVWRGEWGGRIGGDTRIRSASRMPNRERARASSAAKKGITRGRPGYLGGIRHLQARKGAVWEQTLWVEGAHWGEGEKRAEHCCQPRGQDWCSENRLKAAPTIETYHVPFGRAAAIWATI